MTKLNKTVLCIGILAVAILGISANIYLKNRSAAYAQSYCSENEGLEKIKQLKICKDENIKFIGKDYALQKNKSIYMRAIRLPIVLIHTKEL